MATITASAAQSVVPARFNTPGVMQSVSRYSSSATLAAADIVQMIKVPAGAVIHDILLRVESVMNTGTGAPAIALGNGDTDDLFASAGLASAAATMRMTEKFGYEFSAEDTIDLTYRGGTGGADTAQTVFNMSVLYSCNIPSHIGGEGTSEA